MQITPPSEKLLAQPDMELMDMLGRMRSLTDSLQFSGTLPAVWQCSDETQMIKKALFGYVFDCPVFNLGRVGALLDPSRLAPASHHGHDLVILGGSHLGLEEHDGVGFVQRIHGEKAPCCGKLLQILDDYLKVYRRAAALITLERRDNDLILEIPYKYLFPKPAGDTARIVLELPVLIASESIGDGPHGRLYRLHPAFAARHQAALASLAQGRSPIGALLGSGTFTFRKRIDHDSRDPLAMLEASIFEYLPDVVSSPHPHRRLADLNTWRQFHRLAAYLTDYFDGGDRNILVIAGLTLDHTVKHNTFIPQYGFQMLRGRALDACYFGPLEIGERLRAQPCYTPPHSFLTYAGVRHAD